MLEAIHSIAFYKKIDFFFNKKIKLTMLPDFNDNKEIIFTDLKNFSADVNYVDNIIRNYPQFLGELLQIIKKRFASLGHIPLCRDILQDLMTHIAKREIISEDFTYNYLLNYCPEFKAEYPEYDANRIYYFSIVEEKNTHTIDFGSVIARGF